MEMLEARFWEKVQKTDECWFWTAAKDEAGYGRFWMTGKLRRAHKASYEAVFGLVPADLILDHLCRHTDCVNPFHLDPTTSEENTRRGHSLIAGHAAKTVCKRGHLFDEENTYQIPGGGRKCKICQLMVQRRRYQRARTIGFNREEIRSPGTISRGPPVST